MTTSRLGQRRYKGLGFTITALIAGLGAYPAISPAGAATTGSGTMISVQNGPFGPMLVVGSGHYAGYTAYLVTSDSAGSYGCTATIMKTLPSGPGSCTGPSNDKNAEWPALTTDGAPRAGSGVQAKLLSAVQRKGIGDQVTYDGHPLYLFDQAPGAVTGEGWDEATLPPWHGVWYVVSPTGSALAWPGALTTETVGKRTVLAALMETGIGWVKYSVYSYSKGSSPTSACAGMCAVNWPPLLTNGKPGSSGPLAPGSVGTIHVAGGAQQVTYDGKPLYLFAYEGVGRVGGTIGAAGNGNGAKVAGGTFSLVSP